MVEVINARLDDGAWRSIKPYKTHPTVGGDFLFVHVMEDRENFIFWDENQESLGYMDEAGVSHQIYDCDTDDFKFTQYKNILIVSSITDMYRKFLIWERTLNTYQVVDFADLDVDLRFFGLFIGRSDEFGINIGSTFGSYISCSDITDHNAKLNNHKKHGVFYGEIMACFAIETIYGEVIKHSAPAFISVGDSGYIGSLGFPAYDYEPGFLAGVFKTNDINNNFFSNIETYRKIISSVNVYITEPKHAVISNNGQTIYQDYDDENFVKNSLFFLAYKYSIDDLIEIERDKNFMVSMNIIKDFEPGTDIRWPGDITDFATRDEMPVDNLSHHIVIGGNNLVYNNRLILMDTKTKLNSFVVNLFEFPWPTPDIGTYFPNPHWEINTYSEVSSWDVYAVVRLKTSDGIKTVQSDTAVVKAYGEPAYPQDAMIFLNRLIVFPDQRAFQFQIYIREHGTTDDFVNMFPGVDYVKMRSHNHHSFSYTGLWTAAPAFTPHYFKNYDVAELLCDYAILKVNQFGITTPSHTVNDIISDPNRVQASAVDNVFYFPAINSYQVGNSRVLAISENAMPVSTGQFGSYPLIVFTENGIWSMNIDPSGQLFVTSITPVSDDILSDPNSITKAGNIVLFATAKGIAAMAGQDVQYLSALIDGLNYKTKIYSNANFVTIANQVHFGYFYPLLTTTRLKDYIGGMTGIGGTTPCVMGYDSIKKELIVCNVAFNYSWVYSFETQLWSKRSDVYRRFLYGRNRTYALPKGTAGTLYMLGDESTAELTGDSDKDSDLFKPMVFITQPFQTEAADIYTKITQLFVDGAGVVNGVKYAGLFLFSSHDGENWYLNAGVDILGTVTEKRWRNMEVKHSSFSAKYHVIMLCGSMADVYISPEIEVSFEEKYTRRSR